jgi:hypothetical protein
MTPIFELTRSRRLFHAAFCWVGLAKTSKIDPSVRQVLERRGVDSVRALHASTIASMSDGSSGAVRRNSNLMRRALFLIEPGLEIRLGEVEDWLKEKDNANASRARVITLLTFVGTVAAIIAATPVVQAWFYPPA